jgi:HEAT repeat protein
MGGWQLLMTCLLSVRLLGWIPSNCWGDAVSHPSSYPGRILFLIQQGEHEQALKLYQTTFQATGQHDFELLHQMGLRILDYGFQQNDLECQLLALFGASVSAHEDAYYILEESLKSKFPEIQLIALNALAHFQNDRADQALLRVLGSPSLEVRYEAVHQLCKKKHPLAISHAESLMYKTPRSLWSVYPPLFAMVGDQHSTRILRKLLAHSSKDVRLAVILSVAKYDRDDLLPQIRQQVSQLQFAQQEACAYTLGCLKDEQSIPKLEKLTLSQYPTVALAAHLALYQLGREESIKAIERAAQQEDLFAIATLGSIPDYPRVLLELIQNPNLQIRFNALIALLQQHHPRAIELVEELLMRDKRDLAFTSYRSPGHTFKAWKVTSSANQVLKNDLSAYEDHLELKESLLQIVREHSEARLIALAHLIFTKQQNDLIPHTVELLMDINTTEAIACLKQHQQQLGAPLVRHYCNLALYLLQEQGPYGEQLRQWVKAQSQTQFIRFQPLSPWEWGENSYTLTPEETSKLLIKAFETFAINQDKAGIETLIESISTGHDKNKYALAGLLLRATQ